MEIARIMMPASENENNEIPAKAMDKIAVPSITYHMILVSVLFALSVKFFIIASTGR
jgi:hypothetical protein